MSEAPKKILVVDDETNIVRVLELRLKAMAYDVCTAKDGLEALEKVVSEKPDLILLDIMMPRMDGPTFLHKAREQKLINDIPVIVLTAKANMQEFFALDHIGFVAKPFSSTELLEKIADYLSDSTTN